jgi:DNA-binding MarR family transcriptional regulator
MPKVWPDLKWKSEPKPEAPAKPAKWSTLRSSVFAFFSKCHGDDPFNEFWTPRRGEWVSYLRIIDRSGYNPTDVVAVLKELEKEGLVVRATDDVCKYKLTEKGADALQERFSHLKWKNKAPAAPMKPQTAADKPPRPETLPQRILKYLEDDKDKLIWYPTTSIAAALGVGPGAVFNSLEKMGRKDKTVLCRTYWQFDNKWAAKWVQETALEETRWTRKRIVEFLQESPLKKFTVDQIAAETFIPEERVRQALACRARDHIIQNDGALYYYSPVIPGK